MSLQSFERAALFSAVVVVVVVVVRLVCGAHLFINRAVYVCKWCFHLFSSSFFWWGGSLMVIKNWQEYVHCAFAEI